jgi:hypothetical protein
MDASAGSPPPQSPTKKARYGSSDLERILQIGRDAMRRAKKDGENLQTTSSTEDRRFREMFGVGVQVALAAWCHLDSDGSLETRTIEDMMRALNFLKTYAKEGTTSVTVGTIDEKTFRKRLWPMIEAIGALESRVVSVVSCYYLYYY